MTKGWLLNLRYHFHSFQFRGKNPKNIYFKKVLNNMHSCGCYQLSEVSSYEMTAINGTKELVYNMISN